MLAVQLLQQLVAREEQRDARAILDAVLFEHLFEEQRERGRTEGRPLRLGQCLVQVDNDVVAQISVSAARRAASMSGVGTRPKKSTPTAASASSPAFAPDGWNAVASRGSSRIIMRAQRR